MRTELKRLLLESACAPYIDIGRFDYHWARGKLTYDPIFAALIDHNVFPNDAHILDLGCGRGLLAAWFLAAEQLAIQKIWSEFILPPRGLSFRGVEIMKREVDCGNRALQPIYGKRVQLHEGDLRSADFSGINVIAMLDVLHYISYLEQEHLLDQIRSALKDEGIFVTRVGDAAGGLRFALSQIVDRYSSFMQGHHIPPIWCRPLFDWIQMLKSRGFEVNSFPMSLGTPFANVMLVSHVK